METFLEQWEKSFRFQILKDIKSLDIKFSLKNLDEIVNATSFDFRRNYFQKACPYYSMYPITKCHDLDDLNCFLCACPNYASDKLEGGCNINGAGGKVTYHENLPVGEVWDCSDCSINHHRENVKSYIRTNFSSLKKIFDSI